jgi:hypothetical protein
MSRLLQHTVLVAEATVRPELGDDYDVSYHILNWPNPRDWFKYLLGTDGNVLPWSDCPIIDLPDVGSPNFNDATNSGVLSWQITAKPGNVPGVLKLGYFLAGFSDPDTPDAIETYTINSASEMKVIDLRIDHWTDEPSPPISFVRARWYPSMLADLA